MRNFPRFPATLVNFLLVASLFAIWYFFAPTQLGGQVSYVMVDGISMEPNYHAGDLVIVRRAQNYKVGEIVTYNDAQMNAHVIHRIIGTQQDRFIMKGDNNTWVDACQPTQAEILGKLWLHLPKMGTAVRWVKTPLHMAFITGGLGGVLMLKDKDQKQKKRRKSRKPSAGKSISWFEITAYTTVILTLVFLGLSIIAFTRPAIKNGDALQYEQTGIFTYTATGTPIVNDSDLVRPPEPIFTKLNCTIGVSFSYILQGDNLEAISGTQTLTAVIQDPKSGWKHTIPLTAETSFSGNATESQTAMIDLCQVQTLVTEVEQKTGTHLSGYYLDIVAHLTVSGKLSGQVFSDSFDPHFVFAFDNQHFYIPLGSSTTNPLVTIQSGTLNNLSMVNNTIKVFGFHPTVMSIRIAALIGLALSLSVLLGVGFTVYSATQYNPEILIHLKYSAILMDVRSALGSEPPIIDVATIDDLAKLAERQNVMIMHLAGETEHTYCVQTDGTTYRYVVNNQPITLD